ncbi:hypothetical protein [Faecalispora jeddahensis]|uniref:hypothetical protein n=1 Tax=Faecalispora jeddahensis TaxID=1414721 RepID=UPI0028A66467|nr:hypothetical protein [Faecalispora jeddahensis]
MAMLKCTIVDGLATKTKKEKLKELIDHFLTLEMPIPEDLMRWWNEETGEKKVQRPKE